MRKITLPIDSFIPEIVSKLESSQSLIIQASPGSGKTTRVPPALLQAKFLQDKEIWVLVPRRLAAKVAAHRVAEEMGEEVGNTVGYQFRFEKKTGPKTRLKFLTEGLLIRQLLHDPSLTKASIVILDEFHERHLPTDVALSYLKYLQKTRRLDLKIIVMSATLEAGPLSVFLENCPTVSLQSRTHPVEISYLSTSPTRPLDQMIRNALERSLEKTQGDILVFLPGMAEILRCEQALLPFQSMGVKILPLHGDLSREHQDMVFKKFSQPKVVLATNVAESSITIEGIRTVIDSGLHRQASYSWWTGIPTLKTQAISQASAIQRAGRAGRTGPGFCQRLYTQADFTGRRSFETPELHRADLSQTYLELKSLGIDPESFSWFEKPSEQSLAAARELLTHLGALEEVSGIAELTLMGRRMAALPLHPRLSRMLLESEQRRCLGFGAFLAALLSEEALEAGDAFLALEHYRKNPQVDRLVSQLLSYFPKARESGALRKGDEKAERALALCLLAGYPDRVAKRRTTSKKRSPEMELVFCSGGSALMKDEGHFPDTDYFIILNVQETKALGGTHSKVHVRCLAPIVAEDLFDLPTDLLQERNELIWEDGEQRVLQLSQIRYGQLVLSETRENPKDTEAAEKIFLKGALGLEIQKDLRLDTMKLLETLKKYMDPAPIEEIFAQLQIWKAPEEIPEDDSLILALFSGLTRTKGLAKQDFYQKFLEILPSSLSAKWNRYFPKTLHLPSGRRVQVHYPLGRGPWIESRLQDFFGMKEGPKIADGKIPLALHLLAPNQRPVQVTTDLGSFWKNTYPQVRKELSRRYPKHRWPENPLTPSGSLKT